MMDSVSVKTVRHHASGDETARSRTKDGEAARAGEGSGSEAKGELYADVVVDITSEKLDRTFQYAVPQPMQEMIAAGMVVEIPFGRGDRTVRGYVTGLGTKPLVDPARIKRISRIITEGLGPEQRLVALAAWMKQRYGGTMIQALKTVIPVKKTVRGREKQTLLLQLSREEAEQELAQMQKKHHAARARLLTALIEQPALPRELVSEKLAISPAVIRALQEKGILAVRSEKQYRNPVHIAPARAERLQLTKEQEAAVTRIRQGWEKKEFSGRYLLHGITGSGKTLVYLELIEEALSRGEQAIVLIPEIALTYQTVLRFYRRFGDRVSFIHSRLSAGERYDQYERAKRGEISVMIGPRSALFTPFPNLGIIVMDEEHERSYLSETTPRYHTGETACARAGMEGALVVFGSATPSLETYYDALHGKICLIEMNRRAARSLLPTTEIVDLRREMRQGNRSVFSLRLRERIQESLDRGEQAMLFLNRRGYAGFVSCRACGHVLTCPHCDVSLSLHRGGQMVCHYCGYTRKAETVCPSCGSGFLRSFRAGTQQIEEEVHRLFPAARVLRMDADTTRQKESHAQILASFAAHEADLLIGTQMIVKGHDFPEVTLVGILAADLSLHMPDYRAAERTFQLLTQAAGRAGRAGKPGYVVIQTYDPEHYAIQSAAAQDYREFYRQEIAYREMTLYPPVGRLMAVHVSGPEQERLQTACDYLRRFALLLTKDSGTAVLGPADAPVAKIQDIYRMVLYLKGPEEKELMRIRDRLQQYVEINEGFCGLSVQYETL